MRFLLLVGTVFLIFGAVSLLAVRYDPTAEMIAPDHVLILLPDENCTTMCWHGIELGESSYEDINIVLHRLPDFRGTTLEEAMKAGGFQGNFLVNADRYHITVSLTHGYILMNTSGLLLYDFLKGFGLPDYQQVYRSVDHNCGGTLSKRETLTLYYIDEQLEVYLSLDGIEKVGKNMEVSHIYYYKIWQLKSYPPPLTKWQGFVNLKELPVYESHHNRFCD